MDHGDNRPEWVARAEPLLADAVSAAAEADAARARSDAAYKAFAEIILPQAEWETQAKIAAYFGKKGPWVSKIKTWYEAGCNPGGPFAPESKARRDRAKLSSTKDSEPDPDPHAAIQRARRASASLAEAMAALSRQTMERAAFHDLFPVAALEEMVSWLQHAAAFSENALRDAEEVLASMRRSPPEGEEPDDVPF